VKNTDAYKIYPGSIITVDGKATVFPVARHVNVLLKINEPMICFVIQRMKHRGQNVVLALTPLGIGSLFLDFLVLV